MEEVQQTEVQEEEIKLSEDEQKQLGDMLSKASPNIREKEMTPWVFANDKTNPTPFGLLDMFYVGAFTNTLGIMVAKEVATGNEVAVLVGLSKSEEGEPLIYPVARLLGAEDTKKYLPPDGKGGYVEFPE